MSFVSDVDEGAEIVRQLLYFDGIVVSRLEFGRLYFVLDVKDLSAVDAAALVDSINSVDDGVDVYMTSGYFVVFDYYVTADLVPVFREVVDNSAAEIRRWSYTSR